MKIFVDADTCPVVCIVEEVAEKYRIDVTLVDVKHLVHTVVSKDDNEIVELVRCIEFCIGREK